MLWLIFQIMSNGEYKAALHRVLANAYHEPRVSVAVFFSPGTREDTYGPLPELVSPVKLALIPSVYSCRVHAKISLVFNPGFLHPQTTLTSLHRRLNQKAPIFLKF
ncbi:hypothetical protein ACFXTH_020569 [Malus domestica]